MLEVIGNMFLTHLPLAMPLATTLLPARKDRAMEILGAYRLRYCVYFYLYSLVALENNCSVQLTHRGIFQV